jgi:hypothetical protein
MNRSLLRGLVPLVAVFLLATSFSFLRKSCPETWGFFAHRRINRLAVLTLPPEMMVFFKPHIDWIGDHAVDADMRRYATVFEAPRHYIDLDRYGTPPFDSLPRTWLEALLRYTELWMVTGTGDTVPWRDSMSEVRREIFRKFVLPAFYRGETALDVDSLTPWLDSRAAVGAVFFRERLSEHGILPWHLQRMQRDLTEAFRQRAPQRILRLCADLGHYLGDAHVPLHTTSNYNGQQTGQHGIHAFWESRLPELFADESYDYFVGKPVYLAHTGDFFWRTVLDSHAGVDSVLAFERELRRTFAPDRQNCPEWRNNRLQVMPCREYAAAYQTLLDHMVERRLRAAIHAVASAWYTAWVDAGQPDLRGLTAEPENDAALERLFELGKMLGRGEEH